MICPVCHKDDQSQKASAVYSGGVGTTSYGGPTTAVTSVDGKWGVSGGYMSGTGHTITNVASKCAPPEKPNVPGIPIKVWLGGIFVLISLCGMSIPSGLGIFGIPPILIGAILIFVGIKQKSENATAYSTAIIRYEKDIMQWNRLYYCHRDDILFDPQTGEYWEFVRK